MSVWVHIAAWSMCFCGLAHVYMVFAWRRRIRDLSRTRTLLAFQGRDPRQCVVDLATDSEAVSAIHVLDLAVGHEDAVQHVPIASVFVKLDDPRGQKVLDLFIDSMNASASPRR